MTVKKQEMPAYDPRAIQGIGLNYATANCGAAHVRGYTIQPEVLGVADEGRQGHDRRQAGARHPVPEPDRGAGCRGCVSLHDLRHRCRELAEMLSAVTGVEYTTEDFMKCGDRIWNLERLWNLQAQA